MKSLQCLPKIYVFKIAAKATKFGMLLGRNLFFQAHSTIDQSSHTGSGHSVGIPI